jgi:hypothetical protein
MRLWLPPMRYLHIRIYNNGESKNPNQVGFDDTYEIVCQRRFECINLVFPCTNQGDKLPAN